ncbi:MAG: AbrB/MazE/SpoVT family DNA-binding domain-containing protein [Kineosporiaceae bacterium]|nr:AbrB/MazE/SpoVT family DNA-binding domain-containing protein [Kineosporiaceae bacterium]
MADSKVDGSPVSPEGRVVIPAEIRRALGIAPGDRVRFVMTGGEVRLISPRQLTMAVWANNHGGDAGDSVAYMRQSRFEDQQARQAHEDRVAEAVGVSADQNPDGVAARVLAELGI